MPTIVVATANKHKVKEFREILGDRFHIFDPSALSSVPEVIESGRTFWENAEKKATAFAIHTLDLYRSGKIKTLVFPLYFVADDSGLEVDVLNGAPGVYSARFAATGGYNNVKDADNNAKLLALLKDVPMEKRTARFRCVVAALEIREKDVQGAGESENFCSSLKPVFFEGVCEGRIGFAPRGDKGFGYDPLFYPVGYDNTFAELGEEVKNKISHRARALELFAQWVKERSR